MFFRSIKYSIKKLLRKKGKLIKPNREKLIKASEHLFYEVRQFDSVSAFLYYKPLTVYHGGIDPNSERERSFLYEIAKNAFLENLLIHMRIILEFLLKKKAVSDDIISKFYMSEENWNKMQKEIKELLKSINLKKIKKRVNKEIVHLTFKRNKMDDESKRWEYINLRENVLKAFIVFYKYADKTLFKTKSKNYFEHISREYS